MARIIHLAGIPDLMLTVFSLAQLSHLSYLSYSGPNNHIYSIIYPYISPVIYRPDEATPEKKNSVEPSDPSFATSATNKNRWEPKSAHLYCEESFYASSVKSESSEENFICVFWKKL